MIKQRRLKLARMLKLYAEVLTDNGLLITEGEMNVNAEVFIVDENNDLVPAVDGTYTSKDVVYTVVNGIITAVEQIANDESVEDTAVEEEQVEETLEEETETVEEVEETDNNEEVEELRRQLEEKDSMISELQAKITELEEKLKKMEEPIEEPIEEEIEMTENFASEVLKHRK